MEAEQIELPELVDDYVSKREKRLALQRELKELEQQESQARVTLQDAMRQHGLMVLGSNTHSVKRNIKPKPHVTDWDLFTQYVGENNAFDVFQRRLNESAIKERVEAGEEIPALDFFDAETISISKVS